MSEHHRGAEGADGPGDTQPATPAGGVYDWYRRGVSLLEGGNAAAASHLLRHAHDAEPESAAVLEALARALYDAGRYPQAAAAFADLTDRSPDDDYARFGLGLSLTRLDRFEAAAEHLALAAAMRPHRREYTEALRQVRATLAARAEAADE